MSSNSASRAHLQLWDYALALYARPHTADCCLHLQDTYAVNVNLLLWCAWLEVRQIRLTTERLTAAVNAIEHWDSSYVQVLRQLRRKMKMDNLALVTSVREQIKQAELLAEKQEHLWLEELTEPWLPEASEIIAGKNLEFYLNAVKVPQPDIEKALAVLIK